MYPLLELINSPENLRSLDRRELPQLAEELRAFLIESVSRTGGHLSSNLGVVELTIALHYVFNTPDDRLVWDVGHQTYPHKILTGRRQAMKDLRKPGALPVFRGGQKVNTIPLVPATQAPRSRPHSVWQWLPSRQGYNGAQSPSLVMAP